MEGRCRIGLPKALVCLRLRGVQRPIAIGSMIAINAVDRSIPSLIEGKDNRGVWRVMVVSPPLSKLGSVKLRSWVGYPCGG